MASATGNNQEIRKRNTSNEEEKKNTINNEEDVVIIPNVRNLENDPNEPGPLTKQKLVSLLIVYFSVFLDIMGVSIIQPVLPFYAEYFGASATQLGALYSSYSSMLLFATFFYGKISDKWGRKPTVLISLFGTCIGFLLTGLAHNYTQLLAFRFIAGLFGATQPVALACITDLVPSINRPKYMGALGAVMAVAFVVGPGLGSGLSEFGIRVPFFVASGLGAFGLIFCFVMLKESNPKILSNRKQKQINVNIELAATNKSVSTEKKSDDNKLSEMDNIKVIIEEEKINEIVFSKENNKIPTQVAFVCLVYFFAIFGWTMMLSMIALYLIEIYNLSTLSVGYVMLSTAVVAVFSTAILFPFCTKKIGMYVETLFACLSFSISLLIVPFVDDLWITLAIIVFGFGSGFGQIAPAMSSMGSEYTNVQNRGTILGLVSSSNSLSQIIGPLLHGVMYTINPSYIFYEASFFVFIAAFIMFIMLCKWPELRYAKSIKSDLNDMKIDLNGDNTELAKIWVYKPDKPTRKDYMKLGKGLGTLLTKRNYLWVTHNEILWKGLNALFPRLSTDNLESYLSDSQFLKEKFLEHQNAFDPVRYV